eukprot:UN33876
MLTLVDLQKIKHSQIGAMGEGISGGERRRLSIACELIKDPPILIMDEPTSGLDSASAMSIGNILQNLCKTKGTTVIATIHQPRASLLKKFHKILLLAEGKSIYYGPTIGTEKCTNYFKELGFPFPEFENPADHLIDVVHSEEKGMIDSLFGGMGKSERIRKSVSFYEGQAEPHAPDNGMISEDLTPNIEFATSFFNQVSIVCQRSLLYKIREPIAMMNQMFNSTILAFIMATFYWQLGDGQLDGNSRISCCSLFCLMQAFSTYDICMLYCKERDLYLKEKQWLIYKFFPCFRCLLII